MTEHQPNRTMVAIDGTDALAYVILRPGKDKTGVVIEAAAKGISKPYAAYALRHTAQSWDPDNSVGQDVGEQLREALAEIARLRADLADEQAFHAKTRDNFEGYSEDTANTLRELHARLNAVRKAAHFMRDDRERLRAELEQARVADAAVLAVMTHYRDTTGPFSRWTVLSDLAVARSGSVPEGLAAPAAGPCACGTEPVHQHGCPHF